MSGAFMANKFAMSLQESSLYVLLFSDPMAWKEDTFQHTMPFGNLWFPFVCYSKRGSQQDYCIASKY